MTEVLLDVVSLECSEDTKWINPSPRALEYIPRALLSLGRWDEFMSRTCNLHFIFEYTLEFGVYEYTDLIHGATAQLEAVGVARNLLTLSPKPLDLPRCIATLREYAAFASANAEQLCLHPEHVFRLALAHGLLPPVQR